MTENNENEPKIIYVERERSHVEPGLSGGAHFLHLLMTLCTFGVWLPVWIIHAAIAGNRGR